MMVSCKEGIMLDLTPLFLSKDMTNLKVFIVIELH